jgi:hypothetical protein
MRKLLLGLAVFALSLAAASADDPWDAWSANFNTVMDACVQANGPKDTSCLFKAFQSKERPAASGTFVDDDLTRDLRTAEVLLHNTAASNDLWSLYGIDTPAYLGTGFSVPLAGEGAKNYEFARQREYFVPNLCAEAVDPAVCPAAQAGIWTWHLSAKELTLWADKPIATFVRAHWPKTDAKLFAQRYAPAAAAPRPDLPPLLLRFGGLPPAYYKGTFGRPDARRVFFADFEQVRPKTLRAAMIATGASTLLDKPDPAKTYFIWIYAPAPDSQASVASWKALFALLTAP